MASSMQSYLKRYASVGDGRGKATTKKRRKGVALSKPMGTGVVIVDHDEDWRNAHRADEEEEVEEAGDGPLVIEDVEVKRMHRMEALKSHRPYLAVADDGSGWVTVKDDEQLANGAPSLQAECELPHLQRRNDSPNSPNLSSRKRGNDFSDLSPPRKIKHSPDGSPAKMRNSSPDLAPPRRSDLRDPSPLRSDFRDSPPPREKNYSRGSSPAKRTDLSPTRRRDDSHVSSDRQPLSRRGDSDAPRRKRTRESVSLSPSRESKASAPRKSRFDRPDVSPSRKPKSFRQGLNNSPDSSPPREARVATYRLPQNVSLDLSPPRKSRFVRNNSPDFRKPSSTYSSATEETALSSKQEDRKVSQKSSAGEHSRKPKIMADGSEAGLKSGREVRQAVERTRKNEARKLSELDPSLSGRGAETVYRDKRGRKMEGLEELLRQEKGDEKLEEQPLEWGKGLAQKKKSEALIAELEIEKSRPFARSRDDPELDKSLRERVRWGDPMAHLVKQKTVEPIVPDFGAREEMKASGFIVPQDIPKHSWLKRGIPPPANRYGIKPGRHWDGVDRSTGFEREMFKHKNEEQALQREAYLWSVSDM